MRTALRKNWLGAVLCAVTLCATAALAERDTFGIGTGRDGALTVTAAGTVVNRYAQVTGPLAPGDTSIPVSTVTGFGAGDLVMVLQTTGVVPSQPSGSQDPLSLNDKAVGRWEFARLASVSGTTLGLTAPLIRDYPANVTQVIRVPEYTNVTINPGGRITATPWNGSTGGVIAFLATGTVSLATNALISASGAGFRGGLYVDDESGSLGCTGLDEAVPQGAQKGEGIDVTRYGTTQGGRGNVANGAGGGVCFKAGGGGGSNAGSGGRGGNSDVGDGSRAVGGLGGTALVYSMLDRLTLGGGGGAGHGTDGTGAAGGRGGGAIFIRANQLSTTVNNAIQAGGSSGGSSGSDGASGGGAGGSISVRFVATAACASVPAITANGGLGGSVNSSDIGPGGGGGGGRILFQSSGGTCNPTAASNTIGANPGSQQDPSAPGGVTYGAQAGSNGIVTRITGGLIVPTVTIATPANGSIINTRRPTLTGTTQPGNTVTLSVDGAVVAQVTADAAGNYAYTLTVDLSEGSHVARAIAEREGLQSPEASSTFTVDVTPPAAPVVATPANGARVNTTTPAISGTAEPGSTVTVFIDGVAVGTTTANASGNWSFTSPALSEGSHTVRATATDPAGNISPNSNTNTFTVDVTPPAAPVVQTPANNSVVNTTTPVLSGTAEAGSTVTVIVDGTPVGTTTANASGLWSLTQPTALSEGPHTVRATATDPAGNVSPSSNTNTFTVDVTPPAAPVVVTPANNSVVNTATPAISGTAEAGSTVTVIIDGTPVGTTTANAAGNWTFTPPALSEGSHTVGATATDPAGNTSPASNTNTFWVDLTPPAPPDTSIVSGPEGTVSSSSATFDFASPEAGVTYECSLDGAAFTPCTDPVTFTGLADGEHTLRVRARDVAGRVDPTPASRTWTVDTTAPAAPILTSPSHGASVGGTPIFSGTAEPGSTITILVDGAVVGTTTANAEGNWTFTPPTPLAGGPHTVTVTATDPAGNTSPPSTAITITVDTTAPDTFIDSGPEGTVSSTSATFDFSSTEEGVVFECSLDGAAFTRCTDPVTFTGLADGEHTLEVRARDAAGNVDATPASRTWTVASGGPPDGGPGDGGPGDGGTGDGEDREFRGGGCGCAAEGGSPSLALFGLGALLALVVRRRRA